MTDPPRDHPFFLGAGRLSFVERAVVRLAQIVSGRSLAAARATLNQSRPGSVTAAAVAARKVDGVGRAGLLPRFRSPSAPPTLPERRGVP
jgi:hypothetical protein